MPPEAKICIIDDHVMRAKSTSVVLELIGNYQIVATAKTKAEALEIIPRFKELGVEVVLLDGNLTKEDISGNDGRELARAIRAQYPIDQEPSIKLIGMSSSGNIEGVDQNCSPRITPEGLVEFITKL
jgi:CheY-like chemotaxis protein